MTNLIEMKPHKINTLTVHLAYEEMFSYDGTSYHRVNIEPIDASDQLIVEDYDGEGTRVIHGTLNVADFDNQAHKVTQTRSQLPLG